MTNYHSLVENLSVAEKKQFGATEALTGLAESFTLYDSLLSEVLASDQSLTLTRTLEATNILGIGGSSGSAGRP